MPTIQIKLLTFALILACLPSLGQAEVKPLKALLITGGCCHDYDTQKNIIKRGLEARAHIDVTVMHQGGSSLDAKIPVYEDPNWADAYDIVLHNECFADAADPNWTARILTPHRNGTPGVVIHCAMHSYRDKTDEWFKFCGVTSHRHGAHYGHAVYNYDATHPVMDGFGAAWTMPEGELYHIAKVWPTAHILAAAKERDLGSEQPCVWTNQYGKARVFGTTLGHHNSTVSDDVYLNLLTRGTLWACGKLSDEYLKSLPVKPQFAPIDLAKSKPASASSEETNKNNLVAHALDGSTDTRWCASNGSFPQWFQVDLEKPEEIRGCQIVWESQNSPYEYYIEGSSDGEDWKRLVEYSQKPNGENRFEFDEKDVRYVRVTCTGNRTGGWASIRELNVFGAEMVAIQQDQGSSQTRLAEVGIPDGFEKTIFAAPPEVNYPVFVAASPEGDVYVAVDKNGSLNRKPLRGAVHRLRDIDGDGTADEVKLFVPNVDSPRGMVWDRDRLYVLHPPHLSAFVDEDGDGRSDRQDILIKNLAFTFKDRPADHTSNGVTLGIDGWLYLAIGDFGFMEAEGADGEKLQLRGGGVLRVRPDGSDMEVYSNGTRNILEVAIDPQMNAFTRDNTNDGGGWDIRLHHFSGMEDHGYPRLFINFGEEVVQPLADYGGGSGCGALYLSEPGFPDGYGDALYTADWGRSRIYKHNPQPQGATFEVDQEEFLKLPRVTDLDVDANGNIYAASWKGATFTYSGEEVGYLVRVRPKGYQAKPLPQLRTASKADLMRLLQSKSHRRRLAAQRELLARGIIGQEKELAAIVRDRSKTTDVRVAVLNLLCQSPNIAGINELSSNQNWDAEIVPHLVRAASISPEKSYFKKFHSLVIDSLQSDDLPTNLAAIQAIARRGSDSEMAKVTQFLDSEDPVIQHTAFRALAQRQATTPLLEVIDSAEASPTKQKFALFALQRIHTQEVVDAVTKRLFDDSQSQLKQGLLVALCRLYYVEGPWKGNSWGTRPDTRGPYYQPETWELSEKIATVLRTALHSGDADQTKFLMKELARHRIDLSGTLELALRRAEQDAQFIPSAVQYVVASNELPASAIELLQRVATSEETESDVRSQACIALLRSTSEEPVLAAFIGMNDLYQQDHQSKAYLTALNAFQNKQNLSRQIEVLEKLVAKDSAAAAWAEAGLIHLSKQKKLSPEVERTVKDSLQKGWGDSKRQASLLMAARITNSRDLDDKIVELASSSNTQVAQEATAVATQWMLLEKSRSTGPKLSTLDPIAVVKRVSKMKGNALRGEQLYAKLTCNKCHTVNPNEPLRGPYLPEVAKTYKRDQLTESILLPSKSLAQGFVTNIFLMEDGRVLSGFITQETPEKIVIRDNQANEIVLDTDQIEGQKKDTVSIMPAGLANDATVQELADLVTYLETLSGRAKKKE